jgi:hypothetical protein
VIQEGQRYELLQKTHTTFLIHYSAPVTGSGEATLPKGFQFRIANDPPTTATAVYCMPLDEEAFEQEFVPRGERRHPRFGGFSLVLELKFIRNHCRRLG